MSSLSQSSRRDTKHGSQSRTPVIVIIGGGITGLEAARQARKTFGSNAAITILEARGRLGGKLKTVDISGDPLDVGAEAFLWARPEMKKLITELNLTDEVVSTSGLTSGLYAKGSLHAMPARTLMGIPSSAQSLTGLVSDATIRLIEEEPQRPLTWTAGKDVSAGLFIAERFGRETVDVTVDPLLGGIHSAHADDLSLRSTAPRLASALDAGAPSLLEAVQRSLPPISTSSKPVAPGKPPAIFGALRKGFPQLLEALRAASGATISGHTPVEALYREGSQLYIDPIGMADAVIIATPALSATRLLQSVAPYESALVGDVELASSAVVAMQFDSDEGLPELSGILISTGEDVRAKAFTLSSKKWPHLAARGGALIRASFGRYGDDDLIHEEDSFLLDYALADLEKITGYAARPRRAYVQRWHGGSPLHRPGHEKFVSAVFDGLQEVPGVALAGAYLQGAGIAGCLESAHAAVAKIATDLDVAH